MGVKRHESRGCEERREMVSRKRFVHLNLPREVVWKVLMALPIEEEDPDKLVTIKWETEKSTCGGVARITREQLRED